MPEVIEAPPDTKPPQVQSAPKDTGPKWEDKFNKALSSLTVSEEKPEAKPDDKPTLDTQEDGAKVGKSDQGRSQPDTEKKADLVPPPEKPSSALEAALGEETKPAEAKPDLAALDKLEAELDQVTTPKSEDWRRAREARKLLREELTKAQSAPKPVDTNVEAITKELEEYKQRVEKQELALKALNAEYSETFQGLLGEREKVLNKVANKMKYSSSDRGEDLVAALGMPEGKMKNAAVKEALSELDEDDKIAVRALIERLDEADEKIAEFKKDLPGQFDRLKAQKELDAREQSEKESKLQEVEFRKILDDLPKDVVLLRRIPDDVTGAKEWNERIDRVTSSALNVLRPNGADFKTTVEIDVKGHLFDDVWKDYVAQNQELKEARARLKEFDSGSPDFKGIKAPAGKGKEKPVTGEDYERAYQQSLNAANSANVGP